MGDKEKIIAAFTKCSSSSDGLIDATTLEEVFKGLDGDHWTTERVAKLVSSMAGNQEGQIRVDELVGWLFENENAKVPKVEDVDRVCLEKNATEAKGYDPWAAPAGALGGAEEDGDLEEPCSPKVPHRKKKREKRANAYVAESGERLFAPETHARGLLLVRSQTPGCQGSFAYVHDSHAKFSEGVQGDWEEAGEGAVRLMPKTFGYCYEESFDAKEILGTCPVVTLCPDRTNGSGTCICVLPAELSTEFSWMDPTKAEAPEKAQETEIEPTSPKVFRKSKSGMPEARGHAYVPKEGEQVYRPISNTAGLLLLRPNNTFAYVHDSQAKFSEGVQGDWNDQGEGLMARLEPKSLGWCYAGRHELHEVVSSCYTLTLLPDQPDSTGMKQCQFPEEILNKCTWLNPTLEGTPRSSAGGSAADRAEVQELSEEEPTSPKIPKRKRRQPEKRAETYQAGDGEELFCPESRKKGMLLLKSDGTFAYVHDSSARFSEGVQGKYAVQGSGKVMLEPTSYGWCYQESFDANEIVGKQQTVTLDRASKNEDGKPNCILSEECLSKISWLDPSRPE